MIQSSAIVWAVAIAELYVFLNLLGYWIDEQLDPQRFMGRWGRRCEL